VFLEYGDYEWQHCGRAQAVVKEPSASSRAATSPFVFGTSRSSASIRTQCARGRGRPKPWGGGGHRNDLAMHDGCSSISSSSTKNSLLRTRWAVGVEDIERLSMIYGRAHVIPRLREDLRAGRSGVNGTPTFSSTGSVTVWL